ncbi:WD repeat-containing protein 34 [Cichlidogyrus casuarinus]|uniref:WD repeat-containing protein 34 n=1 Tax=Cichlidogyrus casuarinus TaxID=1844966 RepID=A0ABD2QMH5_9PLAT
MTFSDETALLVKIDSKIDDKLYGDLVHSKWCYHDGLVAIYNVNVGSEEDITQSAYEIKTPSCAQCVAFHPSKLVLAAGLFTGALCLWNFDVDSTKDYAELMLGGLDIGHHACIKAIKWISTRKHEFLINNKATEELIPKEWTDIVGKRNTNFGQTVLRKIVLNTMLIVNTNRATTAKLIIGSDIGKIYKFVIALNPTQEHCQAFSEFESR